MGTLALLTELGQVLANLKRFEQNFSPDAKTLLQKSLAAQELGKAAAVAVPDDIVNSVAGYLIQGVRLYTLREQVTQLQQLVTSISSGAIPLPRSSKDDLSRLQAALLGTKVELPQEQQLAAVQLKKLCADINAEKQDIDIIETQLDNVIRSALEKVHNAQLLAGQELEAEQKAFQLATEHAEKAGNVAEVQYLSLAHNSLQRLHASQLESEDESEQTEADVDAGDVEEDDDDDPFFMPMPGAIKWADADKFRELAAPLAPEQPADKQFMIMMEEEESASDAAATCTTDEQSDSVASPVASPGPKSPVQPPSVPSPRPPEEELRALTVQDEAPDSAEPNAVAGPSGEGGDKPDAAAAASGTGQHPPEKLAQFVNFLNGENPGACMFHAQMRLSVEGCTKLSNFLKSSARVRALSLSHNYLGDEGLRILCDGLSTNTSLTSLDLPDNNITDVGAALLAEAIKNNQSLTQLQLAYNRISDYGASALAEVIKRSQSLKKLGLSNNNIGKAGCQALTAAISSNQSLKHLQLLPGNPVEEKDAKALAKALKRNNKFSIKTFLGIKKE